MGCKGISILIHRVILSEGLPETESIVLSSENSHYLLNVLRLERGSELELIVPGTGIFSATIIGIDDGRVLVSPGARVEDVQDRESPLKIHVIMPFLKGERTNWAIQKSVETGAYHFSVGVMDHSVVRPSGSALQNRIRRLQRIVEAACKQSGRSRIPVVDSFRSIDELDYNGTVFVLDPLSADGIEQFVKKFNNNTVSLIIGPEGGFSGRERDFFIRKGCLMQSMGPRILRAETAVVAGVVALQTWLGDMR